MNELALAHTTFAPAEGSGSCWNVLASEGFLSCRDCGVKVPWPALYQNRCHKCAKKAVREQKREYQHRRRARMLGNGGQTTVGCLDWLAKMRKKRFVRCYYCETRIHGKDLTQDHIVAISAGGQHANHNLAIACKPCNFSKIAKPLTSWVPETRQAFLSL